ncbi:MAG TPA: hypothetical protein VGO62_22285, partial [Myxococcota bacterium]
MPRTKVTTTTRIARGRERALPDGGVPIAFAAALDAIARHRAANEPLDRCTSDVSKARHLGGRERRALGDLVFAWARLRATVEPLIEQALAAEGGIKPSRRDRDLCALALSLVGTGLPIDDGARARLLGPLATLVDDAAASGISAVASLPAWLTAALTSAHGDTATKELIRALAQPAPLVLAIDARHASLDEVQKALAARGIASDRSAVAEGALRLRGRASLA